MIEGKRISGRISGQKVKDVLVEEIIPDPAGYFARVKGFSEPVPMNEIHVEEIHEEITQEKAQAETTPQPPPSTRKERNEAGGVQSSQGQG